MIRCQMTANPSFLAWFSPWSPASTSRKKISASASKTMCSSPNPAMNCSARNCLGIRPKSRRSWPTPRSSAILPPSPDCGYPQLSRLSGCQYELDFIRMSAPPTRVNLGCITTKAREEGADIIIIGVDYHPSFQQIAFMDQETGECRERELKHSDGEAEKFYRELKQRGISVRLGMEASRWFERLLAELGFEVWIGDAAEIKTKRVRKKKTDREDARLLLKLLLENRFPRIWVPSPEDRDLRQLLWHRHRLVQMRTRIMNQLQAVAMNEGKRWKKKLWSGPGRAEFEKLALSPWASRRRQELLELLDRIDPTI